MKAVIDTNVFVSGIFWKGPPHKILTAWSKGSFQWIISQSILEEYRRVLAELSNQYPLVRTERILELLELNAELVTSVPFVHSICKDPDDDKFLEAALAARAEYVVSGDKLLHARM